MPRWGEQRATTPPDRPPRWGAGAAGRAKCERPPRGSRGGRSARPRPLRSEPWAGAYHVWFVCSGNICRSPIAEKVFAREVEQAGLADRVQVTSAGTGSWHVGGSRPTTRAAALLVEHGYDDTHVARQVDDELLAADLLVALDDGPPPRPAPGRPRSRTGVGCCASFDPAAPAGGGRARPVLRRAGRLHRGADDDPRGDAGAAGVRQGPAVTARPCPGLAGAPVRRRWGAVRRGSSSPTAGRWWSRRARASPPRRAGLALAGGPGGPPVPTVLGARRRAARDRARPGRHGRRRAAAAELGRRLAVLHAAGAPAFGSGPPGTRPRRRGSVGHRWRNVPGLEWAPWYAAHRIAPVPAHGARRRRPDRRRGRRRRARVRTAAGAGRAARAAGAAARRPLVGQRAVDARRGVADRPRGARRPPGDRPRDAGAVRLPAPGHGAGRVRRGGARWPPAGATASPCTSCSRCWCTSCCSAAATPGSASPRPARRSARAEPASRHAGVRTRRVARESVRQRDRGARDRRGQARRAVALLRLLGGLPERARPACRPRWPPTGQSRASAVAVVGVLGDQARRHAGLAEDHLDERAHRASASRGERPVTTRVGALTEGSSPEPLERAKPAIRPARWPSPILTLQRGLRRSARRTAARSRPVTPVGRRPQLGQRVGQRVGEHVDVRQRVAVRVQPVVHAPSYEVIPIDTAWPPASGTTGYMSIIRAPIA